MRRRNTELHARVNGNLAFEFSDAKLTSYAGLELFDRYLRRMGFSNLIRTAFAESRIGGDWPTARTVSRWLKRFSMKSVEHLVALNAAVVAQILPRQRCRRSASRSFIEPRHSCGRTAGPSCASRTTPPPSGCSPASNGRYLVQPKFLSD